MDEDDDKIGGKTRRGPSASEIDEAADWLLRLRQAPHDAALRRAFEAWLDRSEEHAAAFRRTERAWALVGSVQPVFAPVRQHARPPADLVRPSAIAGSRSGSRRHRAISLLAAAAASIAVLAAVPRLLVAVGADYATGTAESRQVSLPDGSRVVLGADSSIDVDLRGASRKVVVLAGEAYFDVAPDPTRPFHVDVGELRVTVVGTRFDVALTPAQTRVDLESGRIDVSDITSRRPVETMSAGDRLVLDRATDAVTRSAFDVEEVAAWRRGQLVVENATIGSVVATIRRYHPAVVAIPDPVLSDLRVTGFYDLRDPDRALAALVEPHGGHVLSVSPYLRILSRF